MLNPIFVTTQNSDQRQRNDYNMGFVGNKYICSGARMAGCRSQSVITYRSGARMAGCRSQSVMTYRSGARMAGCRSQSVITYRSGASMGGCRSVYHNL